MRLGPGAVAGCEAQLVGSPGRTVDLNALKVSAGKSCGQAGYNPNADVNNDCVVNALDLNPKAAGFAAVTVIDDDLGRSGSGLMVRPGFQKLVAAVCAGGIGAVFCLEA